MNLIKWQEEILREAFERHRDESTLALPFEGFIKLAEELKLQVATFERNDQERVFDELRALAPDPQTISSDVFRQWVEASNEADTAALEAFFQERDPNLYAAAVRAVTNLTRPLTTVASSAFVQLKCGLVVMAKKMAIALKTSMENPSKLFRRAAVTPLEALQCHPDGLLPTLRAEVAAGGMRGLSSKLACTYFVNSLVSVSMFHTYTTTRVSLARRNAELHGLDGLFVAPLPCEAASGAAAGVVQATLSTPLYNLKIRRKLGKGPGVAGIAAGLRDLHRKKGMFGVFQNYRFVVVQESLSLASFFASYEYFKFHTTSFTRFVEPSGRHDMYAWVVAASAAGGVLCAVGTPFENVLEWHVTRRTETTPIGVLAHFWHDAPRQARKRILLSGLSRKLPLAPLGGLPLLVYEAMVNSGMGPVLHHEEERI